MLNYAISYYINVRKNIKGENISRQETENLYVRRALEYIQNNYHYGIRVSDIADYVGVTRGYLHTLFTKSLSQSPQEYLVSYRITRAQQLLEITDLAVEGVAQSCGYSDPLVFSKLFKKKTGKTPSAYRRESLERSRTHLRSNQDRLDTL